MVGALEALKDQRAASAASSQSSGEHNGNADDE